MQYVYAHVFFKSIAGRSRTLSPWTWSSQAGSRRPKQPSIAQHSIVQCSIVQYNVVQYSIVQYSIVAPSLHVRMSLFSLIQQHAYVYNEGARKALRSPITAQSLRCANAAELIPVSVAFWCAMCCSQNTVLEPSSRRVGSKNIQTSQGLVRMQRAGGAVRFHRIVDFKEYLLHRPPKADPKRRIRTIDMFKVSTKSLLSDLFPNLPCQIPLRRTLNKNTPFTPALAMRSGRRDSLPAPDLVL